ncbi:hypothetical protein JXA31_09705 [Candidatus Bathyarchaeota archaeon]|nr:hypothetical protein [Candidatus Bathyarchaeota archaeon]
MVYETNADLIASHEVMVKNPLMVADRTEKGLLWFKFRENRTVFLLSPLGKLQVKWTDASEKRTLFRLVRNLLVAKPNEKLEIKPLKQQTWIEYPVPDSFKIYWCDGETEFVLKTSTEPKAAQKPDTPKAGNDFSADKLLQSTMERLRTNRARVRAALEELRREFRFLREPTFNEVAIKSGCLDSQLKTDLLLVGWKHADFPEAAECLARQAVNVAAWLRFRETGQLNPQLITLSREAIDNASLDAIKKAQVLLKHFPELVPTVEATELKWPDETKTLWIKVFGSEPPSPQSWTLSIDSAS